MPRELKGWLKLHRSIVDSIVFENAEVLRLWIWLLCNAAYDEYDTIYNGKLVHISKGQIVTSRKKMAQQLGISESTAYRTAKSLENIGKVNIKTNNKFSIITIIKWDDFQNISQSVNSKANNKRTANEQQTNSKANTIKEYKEYKKKRRKEEDALSGDLPAELLNRDF